MPLETASFIHQLEPANPAGTDQLAQGDDHLRLLKAVLKSTFPNLTGAVTKTQAELNAPDSFVPAGVVSMWYGTSGTIPAGYALCNGQTVARTDGSGDITTPDMTNLLPIGAGSLAPQGTTAGAASASATTGSAGSHAHTVSGGAHTHSVSLVPATTGGSITTTTVGVENEQSQATVLTGAAFVPGAAHTHTGTADSASHDHTLSSEGAHQHSVTVATLPPVRGLHFIMKT